MSQHQKQQHNQRYQQVAQPVYIPQVPKPKRETKRNRALEHGVYMSIAVWFGVVCMIMTIRISLYMQGVHHHPLEILRDMLAATVFAIVVFASVYALSVDWHKRMVWWAEWKAIRSGMAVPVVEKTEAGPVINMKRQMFRVGKTQQVLLPEKLSLQRLLAVIKANVDSGRFRVGDKMLSARFLADSDVLPQADFTKYNKFFVEHGVLEPAGKTNQSGMKLTQKGQTCFRVNAEAEKS